MEGGFLRLKVRGSNSTWISYTALLEYWMHRIGPLQGLAGWYFFSLFPAQPAPSLPSLPVFLCGCSICLHWNKHGLRLCWSHTRDSGDCSWNPTSLLATPAHSVAGTRVFKWLIRSSQRIKYRKEKSTQKNEGGYKEKAKNARKSIHKFAEDGEKLTSA